MLTLYFGKTLSSHSEAIRSNISKTAALIVKMLVGIRMGFLLCKYAYFRWYLSNSTCMFYDRARNSVNFEMRTNRHALSSIHTLKCVNIWFSCAYCMCTRTNISCELRLSMRKDSRRHFISDTAIKPISIDIKWCCYACIFHWVWYTRNRHALEHATNLVQRNSRIFANYFFFILD